MAAVQTAIVILLVGLSILASIWWLTPARGRLWILNRLVSADTTKGYLHRLRASLLNKAALGACGACKANVSAGAAHSKNAAGLPR
jgi:cytochrome c553